MAIQEMLTGYRSTQHPATGVTLYEALTNRQVRTKLVYQARKSKEDACDLTMDTKDVECKEKINIMLRIGTLK